VSNIINLLKGYGFISAPPNNIFFSYRDLVDCEFSELRIGDPVEFMEYKGENGEPRAANVRKAKGKPIITPVV
jgi:cold shock CspA family protein